MEIAGVLSTERVAAKVQVKSKKKALQIISERLAASTAEITSAEAFGCLIEREKLGSTGLGHGVALPHGRLRSAENVYGVFLQLAQAIDFDALDNQPVDLLFALLVPQQATETHLRILARLAEMFRDKALCERLRHAENDAELFDLLRSWEPKTATA